MVLSGDTSGAVTLSVPAVAGTNTITVPAATGTMLTTASTAVVTQAMLSTNVASNGPAFSAYLSGSAQTVSTAWTKLACNTKEFDTNSNYDNTTNFRFTPTVAGYYQANMGFSIGGGYGGLVSGGIYKNGTLYKQFAYQNSTWYDFSGSCLVYCNGSTDYIEAWGFINTNSTFGTGISNTYFQASMVRSA